MGSFDKNGVKKKWSPETASTHIPTVYIRRVHYNFLKFTVLHKVLFLLPIILSTNTLLIVNAIATINHLMGNELTHGSMLSTTLNATTQLVQCGNCNGLYFVGMYSHACRDVLEKSSPKTSFWFLLSKIWHAENMYYFYHLYPTTSSKDYNTLTTLIEVK